MAESACITIPNDYGIPSGFVFALEKNFNNCDWEDWVRAEVFNNWTYWVTGYIIAIFGIQRFMKDKKPFELRTPLFLWNLGLAIFSTFGAYRAIPHIYEYLREEGFVASVCNSRAYGGVFGFWAFLFAMSKIVEFGDTLFIVLRKKPLTFLHYFHHIVTALYALYVYSSTIAVVRWFVMMNYAVHGVMYSYYALSALGYRLPRVAAMTITTGQVAQMFMGFAVTLTAVVMKNTSDCVGHLPEMYVGLSMYLLYIGLFTNYFVNTYLRSSNRSLPQNNNTKKEH